MGSLHSYETIRCTSNHLSFPISFFCWTRSFVAEPSVRVRLTSNEGELLEPRQRRPTTAFSLRHRLRTNHHPAMPPDPTDEHGGSLSKAQEPPPSSSRSSEGSPSSLIMARGRSRVRRISSDADPFSEENLRKRCVSGETKYTKQMIRTSRIILFFHAVAITVSNHSTRLSTSKGDGS